MSDFEPRMDKWSSGSAVNSLGLQFRDSIENKGRTKRNRRRARKAAERHYRRMQSPFWRTIYAIKKFISICIALALLAAVGWFLFAIATPFIAVFS
ncbi:hypothetical protein K1718_27455 (plasmid) [Roseibium porphyridii]|uniref:Uncharacterized protein n=1 Tax=Roseibium porphyridii TaxID=2866279 RepID=A0ABY8FB36_9HYPH|nr:hypothetical protein [Roseibium sp. KMA01]WFE92639.1 hypothetical protein K1718_27455 [Roseibium sp. KMA01]